MDDLPYRKTFQTVRQSVMIPDNPCPGDIPAQIGALLEAKLTPLPLLRCSLCITTKEIITHRRQSQKSMLLKGIICVLDRAVYSDCVVQDLTQLHMLAVTCATRIVDAAVNYLLETTTK